MKMIYFLILYIYDERKKKDMKKILCEIKHNNHLQPLCFMASRVWERTWVRDGCEIYSLRPDNVEL